MARAPETETPSGSSMTDATSACLACGATTSESFCRACGYEQRRAASARPSWPSVGDTVSGGDVRVELRAPLCGEQGAWRFLGEDEASGRYEVIVVPEGDPDDVLSAGTQAREALGPLGLPTTFGGEGQGARFVVTRLPDAPSLAEGLTDILADPASTDAVTLVHRWVLPLTRCLADLHRRGLFLGGSDPAEVLIDAPGRVWLRRPQPLHRVADGAVRPGRRRAVRGFAAPEVHGRGGGEVDARADVFFAGAVLYYVLARIAPLAEAGLTHDRLPPPHAYHEDVPPELEAIARRATSPLASRRYKDAVAMLHALDVALDVGAARYAARPRRLAVDVGHEMHIGVLKGQYAPQNQDDLFLAHHADTGIGLFVVTDGVSISEYGTGDIASRCVREEALELWRGIVQGRFVNGDDADDGLLEVDETLDGRPLEHRPALPAEESARRALLRRMLDAANRRIGELISVDLPRFPGRPEGIMAATAVIALIEGNRVTLTSIGDSRIYLLRDGHMSSLMIDHNLATQLMRMGRPPLVARAVPAAGALIRCVGEFEKDAEHRLVPVPLQPDTRALTLLPGDTLLLCSDGIPDYAGFDEEDAERRMREAVEAAPGAPWAAFELMVLANRGGGGDNISCVVLRFGAHDERIGGRR